MWKRSPSCNVRDCYLNYYACSYKARVLVHNNSCTCVNNWHVFAQWMQIQSIYTNDVSCKCQRKRKVKGTLTLMEWTKKDPGFITGVFLETTWCEWGPRLGYPRLLYLITVKTFRWWISALSLLPFLSSFLLNQFQPQKSVIVTSSGFALTWCQFS